MMTRTIDAQTTRNKYQSSFRPAKMTTTWSTMWLLMFCMIGCGVVSLSSAERGVRQQAAPLLPVLSASTSRYHRTATTSRFLQSGDDDADSPSVYNTNPIMPPPSCGSSTTTGSGGSKGCPPSASKGNPPPPGGPTTYPGASTQSPTSSSNEQLSSFAKCNAVAANTLVTGAPSHQTYTIAWGLIVASNASLTNVLDSLQATLQSTVAPPLTNCAMAARRRQLQQQRGRGLQQTTGSTTASSSSSSSGGSSMDNVVFGPLSTSSVGTYENAHFGFARPRIGKQTTWVPGIPFSVSQLFLFYFISF